MVDGDVDIAVRLFYRKTGAAETAARASRNQTFGKPGQADRGPTSSNACKKSKIVAYSDRTLAGASLRSC